MKKLMTLLTAALMTAVVLAHSVQADDSPKAAPKATAAVLTDESLGVMLEQLGFEPQTKNDSGGIYYTISIEHDGWTLPYTVELSPNKKFLWITISACTLAEGQEPSAEVMLKLLDENDRNGPAKITFNKQFHKIMLKLGLFNRGITPAVLREQIGSLNSEVQTVSKLCESLRAPGKQN